MAYDPDHINRDIRRVRDQFEQERRYQQRIDNVDRIAEALRNRREPSASGGGIGASPVVWFFGLVGALLGAAVQPFGTDWFFGGFAGFVGAGMGAGFLSKSERGQAVLWIAGLGIVAFVVLVIILA